MLPSWRASAPLYPLGYVIEGGERLRRPTGKVGIGEMGHQGDPCHRWQCSQALPGSAVISRCETQPIHSAIKLQVDAEPAAWREAGQPVNLPGFMHGER